MNARQTLHAVSKILELDFLALGLELHDSPKLSLDHWIGQRFFGS